MNNTSIKITRYQIQDLLRSRWVVGYAVLMLLLCEGLLRFSDTIEQGMVGVTSVVLLVVPLVSLVFGTSYLYNNQEFSELILTQPVQRSSLFMGLYCGLGLPLIVSGVLGSTVPFFVRSSHLESLTTPIALAAIVTVLTLVFVAIAFVIAVATSDKVRGIGVALFTWFFMAVLFDGIVLLLVQVFRYYPLEQPVMFMMILNPADLARVIMLLVLDASAMMGYTGAVVERFMGSGAGILACSTILLCWLFVPLFIARRVFYRKDF